VDGGAVMDATIAKLMKAEELDTYQGKVSNGDIENIAAQTGCALPDDYVSFLQACGFAFWTGHAINGVFDENDPRFPKSYNFSVITQTMRARQLHVARKYPNYENSVVIGKDDIGGYFLLISAAVPVPNRVVWVSSDEDWVITDQWTSFADFLGSQLAE
jgi:SMI1-KNR4 cell-wall